MLLCKMRLKVICYLVIWVRYIAKFLNIFKLNQCYRSCFRTCFLNEYSLYFNFQGLGLRPGVIDGAISISAVQVCIWSIFRFTVFIYSSSNPCFEYSQFCKSCLVYEKKTYSLSIGLPFQLLLIECMLLWKLPYILQEPQFSICLS